ncbi:MAG: GTP cyclohydrolase I [Clostridia bacterium]|nr:GTP cyclohydrolase I [Clostridia bacterium]
MNEINKEKIRKAIKDLLEAIGEDADREGMKDTRARRAKMYEEVTAG